MILKFYHKSSQNEKSTCVDKASASPSKVLSFARGKSDSWFIRHTQQNKLGCRHQFTKFPHLSISPISTPSHAFIQPDDDQHFLQVFIQLGRLQKSEISPEIQGISS
jgi:hypothetical protein